MPYITQDRRNIFDPHIKVLQQQLEELGFTSGDLNYIITRLAAFYFIRNPRYKMIAKITGVLENVKQELYSRLFKDYENSAKQKNEDIEEFK